MSHTEYLKCYKSPAYFIHNYCFIYDAELATWIPFHLWPEQRHTLDLIHSDQKIIVLKARQLGLTWLVLCYILWLMLFRPIITALVFSRRDDEAMYLLSDERLKGVYKRLPEWLREMTIDWQVIRDSAHNWLLANGSICKAFPTGTGDSYTANIALVDEADLVPDLNVTLKSVEPTVEHGGKLILISKSDKKKPQSEFKNIYRAAKSRLNDWTPIFLPWYVRPARDQKWYEAQKRDIMSRTGSDDDLKEQYPATDTEALSPKTLDKRFAPVWLEQCYVEQKPIPLPDDAPSIPGLVIWEEPQPDEEYVIGIDPAEGNPTSNDSALQVLKKSTGEQVAKLKGKIQPAVMASYAHQIGMYYNEASLLPERNNHGHAVIMWLAEHSSLKLLTYTDKRPGWLSSPAGKTMAYDEGADTIRAGDTIIHDFETFTQLQSIEGDTLRAPEGELDDLADSYIFGLKARTIGPKWKKTKFMNV